MKLLGGLGIAVAISVLAACGSTQPAITATPTATATIPPTIPPTPLPTPVTATVAFTGGWGDTTQNPDSPYNCVFARYSTNGTLMAYLTAAGVDTSWLCSIPSPNGVWKLITGATVTSGKAACWETAPDDGSTLRIYMAPTGALVNTALIFSEEFKADNVTDPSNG